MKPIFHLFTLLLATAPLHCTAQTVYRCPGGYSQTPCAGGTALDLSQRQPDRAEQIEAERIGRRDASLADRMERARLQQEASATSTYIPPQRAEPEPRIRTTAPEVFRAVVPGSGKPKAKAKRTAKAKKAQKPSAKSAV